MSDCKSTCFELEYTVHSTALFLPHPMKNYFMVFISDCNRKIAGTEGSEIEITINRKKRKFSVRSTDYELKSGVSGKGVDVDILMLNIETIALNRASYES